MKKTINKNNWSGEEVTYWVSKDGNTIKIDDYVFTLKEHKDSDDDLKMIEVFSNQHSERVLILSKWKDDEWTCDECGVSRESENKDEVVVQMYCNIF